MKHFYIFEPGPDLVLFLILSENKKLYFFTSPGFFFLFQASDDDDDASFFNEGNKQLLIAQWFSLYGPPLYKIKNDIV